MTEWEHAHAVVRANPRRSDEGVISYIERLAVLIGYMQPADAVRNSPKGPWFDVVPPTPARDAWSVAPSDDEEREAIQSEPMVLVPPATPSRLPYADDSE